MFDDKINIILLTAFYSNNTRVWNKFRSIKILMKLSLDRDMFSLLLH